MLCNVCTTYYIEYSLAKFELLSKMLLHSVISNSNTHQLEIIYVAKPK